MTVEEWLIDAVRIRPIIWKTKDKNYKDSKLKNEAFKEIADEQNMEVQDIKDKWHSIRSAFSRALRMQRLHVRSGQIQKREWKHFNKLEFLLEDCRQDEFDDQIENEFTVSIVTEDDESSATLYHLPTNEIDNSLPIENNESNTNGQTANLKNINRKRKSCLNALNTSTKSLKNTSIQNHANNSFVKLNQIHQTVNSNSEEEIFGRSIAASLRKFDDKKKEIVKLKLQEVIVQYLNNDQ